MKTSRRYLLAFLLVALVCSASAHGRETNQGEQKREHAELDATAYKRKWQAMLKGPDFEKEVPAIRREIEALLENNVRREEALLAALFGYDLLADEEALKRVEDQVLKEFPRSAMARDILIDRAMGETDKAKQITLIEEFITRFPGERILAVMYPVYFRGLAGRTTEPGDRIAKAGLGWIKSVSEVYEEITSRWTVAVALAERRYDLDLAQSIVDEALKIADDLNSQSPSLGRMREDSRPRFITMVKTRAHLARGFVLLRRGKIQEASKDLVENLQPVIEQVEKSGYILWKDMDLRMVGVRPGVLWLAELYEAQGDFERARKYLLAGFSDNEQANDYIRERLPIVFAKLGRSSSDAATALSETERRYNSLVARTPVLKDEVKRRLLSDKLARPAPEFQVLTLDKKIIRSAELRGKVVVLNFWATWCGPCVEEMPHFEKAVAKYRGDSRVAFLAVSIDEKKLAVRPFLEKNKYTMLAAYDDNAAKNFGVRGIPATYFIDPDGVIQFYDEGFGAGDSDYVERLSWRVDELLKQKAEAAGTKQH